MEKTTLPTLRVSFMGLIKVLKEEQVAPIWDQNTCLLKFAYTPLLVSGDLALIEPIFGELLAKKDIDKFCDKFGPPP